VKRAEVIERLKTGDEIIFDKSPLTFSAHFRGDMGGVRTDTVMKLVKEGLVIEQKSATAHGIYYLTWKGET